MSLFPRSVFRKRASCPSSQTLLAYCRSDHGSKETEYLEIHLASCDFCNAELQLLTRHRNYPEECASVEMPAQLRRFAEDLLKSDSGPFKAFAEIGKSH